MDRIEAYADGQLDLGSSLNIEQHLIGCETCAAALEKQQTLRSVMGRASLYYDAPPQLSARIRSAVRRQAKVPAVSRPAAPAAWRWFAVAAPAAWWRSRGHPLKEISWTARSHRPTRAR
jgi:anti-sigma factor RsiW